MQDGLAGLNSAELIAANNSLNKLYADTTSGVAMPGGDCDYSLKGVGALYTAHWHGKRVHDALSVVMPLATELSKRPLSIVDVGAGTDATLWAWSLMATLSAKLSKPFPIHSWTRLDTSHEMLRQGDRLWARLQPALPLAGKVVNRQPGLVADWRASPAITSDSVLFGSYLFSRADAGNPTATGKAFADFLRNSAAYAAVLWTKSNKSSILASIQTQLKWRDVTPQSLYQCPLQGQMRNCLQLATSVFSAKGAAPDDQWPRRFNWGRAPSDAPALVLVR